ncbi:choice-of-anchor J domain-containing protein [Flavobacterium sp. PLA-1-15]|uniref:choice-of-anchor J domain-containing protein n=1 Tax=Flavobacterium sp. PLA-1-15 TaxID=3380533 RepID=UPI003B7F0B13
MKKITFCLLLFLAMLQSQGQVLIGNGTTFKNLPINPNYGYTYSQSIYTAAEINATGNITGISWQFTGSAGSTIPNSQNLKIFLGHTSQTNFASGSDWKPMAELTEVYVGGITTNGPGWVSITFDTPFPYNGTDNLVIATAELQQNFDAYGNGFISQEVSDSRSLVYQSDGTPPNFEALQNGNTENYLPNIIFSGIQKACPTPFFLNTAVVTNDFAVVVWANGATGSENSSQYYLSQTNEAPSSSTEPTGSGNPAMLNGLQGDTLYHIWVRNFCSGTPGEWSYSTTFRTECNTQADFIENFDTTPVNSLPACWSSIVRGPGVGSGTTTLTYEGEAFTGANSVRLFNGSADNTADIILVSPKLSNLASNTHRLRFYADANTTSGIVIGTLNNNTSTATFTPLDGETIEIATQYAEYNVDFSSYTGTDTYIGFRLNAPTTYNPVSLDNIRWEPAPACDDVTEISVDDTQPTTATISWAGGSGNNFEVVYDLTSGTMDPSTLTASAENSFSAELTGLANNSFYNVWVRSTCGDGSGSWIGPVTFKTHCEPIADFVENFDTTTSPVLPTCWTAFIRTEDGFSAPVISTTASNSITAPNSIFMTPGSHVTVDTENDAILVSPKLSTVGSGTHRLKFSAKGGESLQVGTMSGTTKNAVFNALENVGLTNNYQEYTVDFSNYQGSDTFFAIRINNASAYTYTYIENVRWEMSPACPDVQNLVLEAVSPSSATISWEESGTESAWEIVYGDPSTIDPSGLLPIVSSDSYIKEITGLEAYTSYAAWVRSDCGTDKGAWIGPIYFKTDCNPVTSLNENFDAVETNTLPSCWTSIVRGTTGTAFAKVNSSYAHSPFKSVEMYNQNQTDDNDVILVSPNLSNIGAGTHRLRFYSSFHNASSIEVGTLDSNTPNAVFNVKQEINLTNNFVEYTVDFTQYAGLTDNYIGIRLSQNGTNSYANIDDVVWEVAPLCPSVINVAVTDITSDTAFSTWEMGEESAENWEISYATSNVTDPNAGTVTETANAQEYSFEELTPNTEYNVWVRSTCGATNGEWVGPKVFRTKCIAGTTFNENFDSTPTMSLPSCWSKIIRGDFYAQNFASVNNIELDAYSGPNNVSLFNSSYNSSNDIILVSPPVNNLDAGTHKLTFYLRGGNTTDMPNIQIGTLNDNSSTAVFTSFTAVTATPNYTQYTIDFSEYFGTDQYIGIRHSSSVGNRAIYVDNIVWEPIVAEICPAIATVDENFDTTAVDMLPECWTAILRGPTENDIDSILVKATPGVSAPNAVNLFKGMSGPLDEQILVLPKLSNLSAGTHKLTFSHAGPPCQIEVGTLSDNTSTAVFTLKESVTVGTNWTESVVDFANYSGTDTYIGLRLNGGDAPFVGMFIDNVIWSTDLGSGAFDTSKFVYYPNPVKNILNLAYEQNITNVAVYNLLGQEIITKNFNAQQTQIDMSRLTTGTYIVKVTADKVNKTFKMIKE